MAQQVPVEVVFNSLIQTRVVTSVSLLAIYEYFITLDQEIASFWRRRLNAASLLLVAVRWAMVLQAIASFTPSPNTSLGCDIQGFVAASILLTSLLLAAIFSGLRVYALWPGDGRVALACAAFLLQLPPFVINMYGFIESQYIPVPGVGCLQSSNVSPITSLALRRAVRISAIFGDALVVGITWAKSFRQLRQGHELKISVPLSSLLFRDGTAYFILLLGINVVELCPLANLAQTGLGIAYIASSLPPILINRFILNLKQLSEAELSSTGDTQGLSSPRFLVSVGNMGEPLDHGWNTADVDEETELTPTSQESEPESA